MKSLELKGIELKAIASVLPQKAQDNYSLADICSKSEIDRICSMTGIFSKRIASANETSVDLMYKAVKRLLDITGHDIKQTDCIICITQTPAYRLPGNSYILCNKLNMGSDVIALDINAGCPGFTHGLITLGKMLDGSNVKNGILVVGDTLSKFITNEKDRFIYGDGAAACLVSFNKDCRDTFACWKTAAEKYDKIISWGMDSPCRDLNASNNTPDNCLFIDGQEMFSFGIKEVPEIIYDCTSKSKISIDDIDLFVFHQTNKLMLEYIGKKIPAPISKVPIYVDTIGSTSSASIPIALCRYSEEHNIDRLCGKICFTGFGTGLSISTVVIDAQNMILDQLKL